MAIAAQSRQPQKGLTFEDVWAMFQESRAEHDRIIAETDKNAGKMPARVDQVTQNVDKLSARVDRVTQNAGGLNRSIGELVETLIAARLWEKFAAYPHPMTGTEPAVYRSAAFVFHAVNDWPVFYSVKPGQGSALSNRSELSISEETHANFVDSGVKGSVEVWKSAGNAEAEAAETMRRIKASLTGCHISDGKGRRSIWFRAPYRRLPGRPSPPLSPRPAPSSQRLPPRQALFGLSSRRCR
ncbi:MAG: hypothetical protein LBK00_00565 [Treponema sp.]|nr:hypothetical protein [Treponema sp.]